MLYLLRLAILKKYDNNAASGGIWMPLVLVIGKHRKAKLSLFRSKYKNRDAYLRLVKYKLI